MVVVVSSAVVEVSTVPVAKLWNFLVADLAVLSELCLCIVVPEVRLAVLSEVLLQAVFQLFLRAAAACKERAAVVWDGGLHVL